MPSAEPGFWYVTALPAACADSCSAANCLRIRGCCWLAAANSRIDAAIHMFFVPFDLAVFWISSAMTIVDKTVARAWRPAYFPARPARFILEVHPAMIAEYEVGDQVQFVDA